MLFDTKYLSLDFVISYEMMYFVLVSWTQAELEISQSDNICCSKLTLAEKFLLFLQGKSSRVDANRTNKKSLVIKKKL